MPLAMLHQMVKSDEANKWAYLKTSRAVTTAGAFVFSEFRSSGGQVCAPYRAAGFDHYHLRENHRQKDAPELMVLLRSVRQGAFLAWDRQIDVKGPFAYIPGCLTVLGAPLPTWEAEAKRNFKSRVGKRFVDAEGKPISPTDIPVLHHTNAKVDEDNQKRLDSLPGEEIVFTPQVYHCTKNDRLTAEHAELMGASDGALEALAKRMKLSPAAMEAVVGALKRTTENKGARVLRVRKLRFLTNYCTRGEREST